MKILDPTKKSKQTKTHETLSDFHIKDQAKGLISKFVQYDLRCAWLCQLPFDFDTISLFQSESETPSFHPKIRTYFLHSWSDNRLKYIHTKRVIDKLYNLHKLSYIKNI